MDKIKLIIADLAARLADRLYDLSESLEFDVLGVDEYGDYDEYGDPIYDEVA